MSEEKLTEAQLKEAATILAKQRGSLGGLARAEKHSAAELSAWGKEGSAKRWPRQPLPSEE